MDAPRLAILGSCVTADIFDVVRELPRPVSYHARSSLISIMSPPAELDELELDWPSGFANRMVSADLRKTFFDDLAEPGCDYLIVDLVDERWDLWRLGETYFTRSQDHLDSGLEARSFERLPRFAQHTHELWLDACIRFVAALRKRLPEVRIVLHRALGVELYRDGDTIARQGAFEAGIPLEPLNRMLDGYYSWFALNARPDAVIDLSRDAYADPGHRWGLTPFHYEELYYRRAAALLAELPAAATVS